MGAHLQDFGCSEVATPGIGSGDHRKLTSMDVRNCLLSITKNVADNEIRTDYPTTPHYSRLAEELEFDTSRVAFQFLDLG